MPLLQLTIVSDNFIDNVLSILHWESEKLLHLLRQPVDKEKWTTEPAVVNAFYSPNKNDIGVCAEPAINDCTCLIPISLSATYSLSRWHTAAAFLQSTLSQVAELRRNRRGDRSRDHARFR